MSEQPFQAWTEAVGNKIIKSTMCGIDGVCQTCAGAIDPQTECRHHCRGRRWCDKHQRYSSCLTEERYCCEAGRSEALWNDVKKQEEKSKKAGN